MAKGPDTSSLANLRESYRNALPPPEDLCGVPDLHLFGVFELPGTGIALDLKALLIGGLAGLLAVVVSNSFLEMPLWLSIPLSMAAMVKVAKDQASATGDGLYVKSGRLRARMDRAIGDRVKAHPAPPSCRRLLVVSNGRELDHEGWMEYREALSKGEA